jgi:hypothetical protein
MVNRGRVVKVQNFLQYGVLDRFDNPRRFDIFAPSAVEPHDGSRRNIRTPTSGVVTMKAMCIPILLAASLAVSACGTTTGSRAGSGAAMGAAGGALIGSLSANAGKGALIGAGVGALGGYLYDQHEKGHID